MNIYNNEKEFLQNYDDAKWDKASLTADVCAFTVLSDNDRSELKVLLVKRDTYPDKDSWSLPGGFMRMDESLTETARRVLSDKAGVTNSYIESIGEFSSIHRDKRTRVVTIPYISLIEPSLSDNINHDNAAWFSIRRKIGDDNIMRLVLENTELDILIEYQIVEELTKNGKLKDILYTQVHDEVSTDYMMLDHILILDRALRELRLRIETQAIAFNLLEDEFTIPEAQQVYEAIWGQNLNPEDEGYNEYTKRLDKSNFTRTIHKYIESTNKTKKTGRPGPQPVVYRLKDKY